MDVQFCRLAYQGRSWATDTAADYNFSIRLSEMTKAAVSMNLDGEPNPVIVRPTDETLFQCPFAMLWQADSLWVSDEDACSRAYLLKGGFIWADDSWAPAPGTTSRRRLPRSCRQPSIRSWTFRRTTRCCTRCSTSESPQIPAIRSGATAEATRPKTAATAPRSM